MTCHSETEPATERETQPCEIPTCPRTAEVKGLCHPCYKAVDRFRSYPKHTLDQIVDSLTTTLERALAAKSR